MLVDVDVDILHSEIVECAMYQWDVLVDVDVDILHGKRNSYGFIFIRDIDKESNDT